MTVESHELEGKLYCYFGRPLGLCPGSERERPETSVVVVERIPTREEEWDVASVGQKEIREVCDG